MYHYIQSIGWGQPVHVPDNFFADICFYTTIVVKKEHCAKTINIIDTEIGIDAVCSDFMSARKISGEEHNVEQALLIALMSPITGPATLPICHN